MLFEKSLLDWFYCFQINLSFEQEVAFWLKLNFPEFQKFGTTMNERLHPRDFSKTF